MYLFYNILLCLVTPFLILFFLFKKRATENITFLRHRLGFYPAACLPVPGEKTRRIWLHAASVGEVNAVVAFVRLLRKTYPRAWIGISTMTLSGLDTARQRLPEGDSHFLFPFDLFFSARRAVNLIRPDLLITVETEIWPNLLYYARRRGARVLMVNGRLSPRTFKTYAKLKRFFRRVLACYDAFSMIRPEDADRIAALGAPREKIQINGNIKVDSLYRPTEPGIREKTAKTLRLSGKEKLLVAGSTREGEEEMILTAFKKIKKSIPELFLLIAPRHPHRAGEIAHLVRAHGFEPVRRTELPAREKTITPESVLILDTLGELFHVYSLATLVFCGGSLVPLGGQNPLEPAAWGKVVLYGPSMEDFADAKKLLEKAGAGIEVKNAADLADKAVALLAAENRLQETGAAVQKLLQSQQGPSRRSLDLVQKLLEGDGLEKERTSCQ